MTTSQKIVLCVDDDEDDRELVCVTINEIDPTFDVVHAENGLEAINYLTKAKARNAPLPCLVILDINMPKMDGKKTLAEIKKDESFSNLPVVLFSTSSDILDKQYCAAYGVDLITKPSNMLSIKQEVRKMLLHCAGE